MGPFLDVRRLVLFVQVLLDFPALLFLLRRELVQPGFEFLGLCFRVQDEPHLLVL